MKTSLVLFSLTALVVGAAVGAGVAMLYAPQSGRVTRSMLQTKGLTLKEKVADDLKIGRAQVQGKLGSLTNEAQNVAGDISEKIKETVSSIPVPIRSNNH